MAYIIRTDKQTDGRWSSPEWLPACGRAGEAHGDYSARLRTYLLLPRGVYVCYP